MPFSGASFISSYLIILQDYPGDAWIEYIRGPESDEMLLDALDPIVNEIEDRMHEKLEQFQSSFLVLLVRPAKN